MAVAWPALLDPMQAPVWMENTSRSGGVALNGSEQTVSSGAGRWRAKITVPIFSNAQVLAARALLLALEGRSNEALVPAFDGKRANIPSGGGAISAVLDVDAALRDTQVAIDMSAGSAIQAGQLFGIGNRLYGITNVVSVVGSVTTVDIRPSLRADAADGDSVEFLHPVCTMKLVSDDQGVMELDLLRFGDLTLEFAESF
jgi:hypothetical protein